MNTDIKTSWTAVIQEDPETGDCILEFPPEMLDQVGWKEGDTLVWKEMDNGAWSLSKKVVNEIVE
jgi:hypothetical protein